MHEFIESASARIGVSRQTARSAARAVLGVLGAHAECDSVRVFVTGLPGAVEMLEEQCPSTVLARLLGADDPDRCEKVIDSAGFIIALQRSGIPQDRISAFTSALLEFGRLRVGTGVVEGTLKAVPELEALLD